MELAKTEKWRRCPKVRLCQGSRFRTPAESVIPLQCSAMVELKVCIIMYFVNLSSAKMQCL